MQDSTSLAVGGDLKDSILHSLAYSAVFTYPLSLDEIIKGMDQVAEKAEDVESSLKELIDIGIVKTEGQFYALNHLDHGFELRLERNKRAEKYLRIARMISRFIGNFPYVRAVFISGSLSKNSLDKDGDIDYFVITSPGRLWVARTLLIFFKKIFLFNSYKFFCLNYFVDTNSLEIDDRNIYTAHELATLLPTYGKETCDEFFKSNPWVQDYLPNSREVSLEQTPKGRKRGLKWIAEFILNRGKGDWLERRCKALSERYWGRKHSNLKQEEIDMTYVLSENKSTYHPENFKYKVLDRFEEIKGDLLTVS